MNDQRSSIDPPPPRDDDDIHAGDLAERLEAACDLDRRALALHARGLDHDVRRGVSASEDLENVVDGGAIERGDDPDLARQRGQRALARRVEQPFLLQTRLELFERQLQRAESLWFEMLADQLVLAFGLVHRYAAARHHLQSVFRLELQIPERGAKDDAFDLRSGVLQREVQMAGVPQPAVRQLAFDPDFVELGFDQIADARRELTDGQRPRVRSDIVSAGVTGVGGTAARAPGVVWGTRWHEGERRGADAAAGFGTAGTVGAAGSARRLLQRLDPFAYGCRNARRRRRLVFGLRVVFERQVEQISHAIRRPAPRARPGDS